MENVEKVRKPRVKKSAIERMKEFKDRQAKDMKSIGLQSAKENLASVPGFTDLQEGRKVQDKYILEGNALLDDESYNARVQSLRTRLANLEQKRAIAKVDTARRAAAKERIDNALSKIGTEIAARIEAGNVPSVEELSALLDKHVTQEDREIVSDGSDPYAAFRRSRNQNENSSESAE